MKSAHLKGGKGQRPHPNKVDGKKSENDAYFMYNMAILVGCPCEVTVRDGRKYDGIFAAYAADKHELLIEAAHRITDENDDEAPITEHYDVLIIPTDKMLSTRFKSVDVNYATRDFGTDQAITASRSVSQRDKELTPWDGADGASDEDLSLEVGVGENGWEAKDMFKKNEEKYGVTSSYKNDLAGYTTQLDKSDVDSFKRHEQQASQVAQEIEKNTISWERGELENGEDEEEAFSAVVRPRNSGHSNINNNNNNNTGSTNAGSDKYIPPSRRQGNVQANAAQSMPQNLPMNNNGANQMNNNSGNPRKQMYSQNQQNPRGNYGVPPNNIYHDRRNNYDSRRAPPPNQYPNPNSHNEVRRMEEGVPGGRQQRVPNKPTVDRRGGRDDPGKLKEFSTNFRLQTPGEQNQARRMPTNQPPHSTVNVNANTSTSSSNISMSSGIARNPSPPSITSSKVSKEDVTTPTSSQHSNADLSDKGSSNAVTTPVTTSGSISASSSSSNIGNVIAPSVNETTPTSGGHSHDNQTPNSGDSKCSDDSKKKFTFNPNAKEFNPSAKSFSSRSPSTPPRPPSTPAAPNTPQMMPAQQLHPSFMPIPMPMLYAQPYSQTAALTPSSNSSVSSGGTTPRHGGHRGRGGGGMLQPRSEMTPNIQMTAGPPLLAPASLQAAGTPHQYAFVPPGHYPQVMRVGVVPQSVMPVYPSEGGGSTQMHQQVHYIQHNGGGPQNNSGQTPNSTPPNNPNVPTSVVSANGQAYGQQGNHGGPLSYPFVSVPLMNMGYPSHIPPHMITVPYVPHSHQGGTTVIPQSQ